MSTELLFLRDAYLAEFEATVAAVEDDRVALDRTAFYPTGGGQPHDTGDLRWDGGEARVVDVRKDGGSAWHRLEGGVPAVGARVHGHLDWDRRHALMRTHTALHVLGGVIWNTWGKPVTGGNMEPLSARMDFEFNPLPEGFATQVEELVNAELAADRPILVSFADPAEVDPANVDASLIRTKVSLVPDSVSELRIVDIVGLDRQADGGTHVASTAEVGRIKVLKTESKGKGNKRVRIGVVDA
jgi:misacylated tRNA(Ala) deacylase